MSNVSHPSFPLSLKDVLVTEVVQPNLEFSLDRKYAIVISGEQTRVLN